MQARKVTNLRAKPCPETSAQFHSYFSHPQLHWVALAQSANPSTQSLLWSDGSHRWVRSNSGKAKKNNSSFHDNYQRNRSDFEISRTNSALTSSNSRIKANTYRLRVPNLVPKISTLIHSWASRILYFAFRRSKKSKATVLPAVIACRIFAS